MIRRCEKIIPAGNLLYRGGPRATAPRQCKNRAAVRSGLCRMHERQRLAKEAAQ